MVEVRRADESDRAQLAAALASAFCDDPLFAWMVGPKAAPEPRLRICFDAVLRQNLRKADHLVFMDQGATGAAVWQPVDRWKVGARDLLGALPGLILAFRGRVAAVMAVLSALERCHPKEPHYYLELLGTRKDRQSRGVGSAVLAAVLERCDREGVPAYLENSNPANVPFYARHGFEAGNEIVCGRGAPVCLGMWREPRTF